MVRFFWFGHCWLGLGWIGFALDWIETGLGLGMEGSGSRDGVG